MNARTEQKTQPIAGPAVLGEQEHVFPATTPEHCKKEEKCFLAAFCTNKRGRKRFSRD